MSALERLGSHVAGSGRERPSNAVRELVELHLVDTVGTLIASTRTVEGANLLRFRASMRERGQGAWALDLATRCALARLSEIERPRALSALAHRGAKSQQVCAFDGARARD